MAEPEFHSGYFDSKGFTFQIIITVTISIIIAATRVSAPVCVSVHVCVRMCACVCMYVHLKDWHPGNSLFLEGWSGARNGSDSRCQGSRLVNDRVSGSQAGKRGVWA